MDQLINIPSVSLYMYIFYIGCLCRLHQALGGSTFSSTLRFSASALASLEWQWWFQWVQDGWRNDLNQFIWRRDQHKTSTVGGILIQPVVFLWNVWKKYGIVNECPHLFFQRSRGWKEKGSNVLKKKKTTSFWNLCFKFQSLQWTWNSKKQVSNFHLPSFFRFGPGLPLCLSPCAGPFFRGRSELGLFFQPVTASLWEDVNWRISQLVFPTGWC